MSELTMQALQERMGHTFTDVSLLLTALTHPSITGQGHAVPHNQRLEFLGDAVLSLCVSAWLYKKYPKLPEGQLTRLRAILVQESTLAECARELRLQEYIRLSKGERQSGGADKPSTLSDAMEAVIAAVYLDGGLTKAEKLVLSLLECKIAKALEGSYHRDCKSELQERVRALWPDQAPMYAIVDEWGPPHQRRFRATVSFSSRVWGEGEGNAKKLAEQNAAAQALDKLQTSGGGA